MFKHRSHLFRAAVCVLVFGLLYVIITPGQDKLINGWVENTSVAILLYQLRAYLIVPFVWSAVAVIGFELLRPQLPLGPRSLKFLRLAGAAFLLAGIYFSVGFAMFEVLPPMPKEIGLPLMRQRWVINGWWAASTSLFMAGRRK